MRIIHLYESPSGSSAACRSIGIVSALALIADICRNAPRDLFADAIQHRNRYGLVSEDLDPQTNCREGKIVCAVEAVGIASTILLNA